MTICSARKGFSLLEIMIALAIIGIIAAFVAPNVFRYFFQAQRSQAENSLRILSDAITEYKIHTGRYPARLQDLMSKPAEIKNWRGPYVEESTLMDPWGNEYQYELAPAGSRPAFRLWSYGAETGPETPESEWIRL